MAATVKASVKRPMLRSEVIAIAMSILALLGGGVGAWHWSCPDIFLRSGAAVVLIALLLLGWLFKVEYSRLKRRARKFANEALDSVRFDDAGDHEEEVRERIRKKMPGDLDEVLDEFRERAAVVETILAAVGTFVWGFGDLFFL